MSVKKQYFYPKLSGSFSGAGSFYRNRKLKDFEAVKSELNKVKEYYLHKPIRRKFQRRKVLGFKSQEQIAFDLIDLQQYAKWNNNFKHILIIIDVFTKKIWTAPFISKSAQELTNAFTKFFKMWGWVPKLAQSDDGKEFINSKLQDFFKSKGVKWFSTRTTVKAVIAERALRTIMSRFARMFTHNDNYNYLKHLKGITDSYNSTFHRTIGMSPNEVTEKTLT